MHLKALLPSFALFAAICTGVDCAARLSDERIIFQTSFGDIEMALYPEVGLSSFLIMTSLGSGIAEFARHSRGFQQPYFTACFCGHKAQRKIAKQRAKSVQVAPVTSQHILKLAKLGAYNTVSFFRVDKGFVAQTADVVYGRLEGAPLDARQLVCTFFITTPATTVR